MADATVSKTVAFGRVGSSPTSGTNHYNNTQTGQGKTPLPLLCLLLCRL